MGIHRQALCIVLAVLVSGLQPTGATNTTTMTDHTLTVDASAHDGVVRQEMTSDIVTPTAVTSYYPGDVTVTTSSGNVEGRSSAMSTTSLSLGVAGVTGSPTQTTGIVVAMVTTSSLDVTQAYPVAHPAGQVSIVSSLTPEGGAGEATLVVSPSDSSRREKFTSASASAPNPLPVDPGVLSRSAHVRGETSLVHAGSEVSLAGDNLAIDSSLGATISTYPSIPTIITTTAATSVETTAAPQPTETLTSAASTTAATFAPRSTSLPVTSSSLKGSGSSAHQVRTAPVSQSLRPALTTIAPSFTDRMSSSVTPPPDSLTSASYSFTQLDTSLTTASDVARLPSSLADVSDSSRFPSFPTPSLYQSTNPAILNSINHVIQDESNNAVSSTEPTNLMSTSNPTLTIPSQPSSSRLPFITDGLHPSHDMSFSTSISEGTKGFGPTASSFPSFSYLEKSQTQVVETLNTVSLRIFTSGNLERSTEPVLTSAAVSGSLNDGLDSAATFGVGDTNSVLSSSLLPRESSTSLGSHSSLAMSHVTTVQSSPSVCLECDSVTEEVCSECVSSAEVQTQGVSTQTLSASSPSQYAVLVSESFSNESLLSIASSYSEMYRNNQSTEESFLSFTPIPSVAESSPSVRIDPFNSLLQTNVSQQQTMSTHAHSEIPLTTESVLPELMKSFDRSEYETAMSATASVSSSITSTGLPQNTSALFPPSPTYSMSSEFSTTTSGNDGTIRFASSPSFLSPYTTLPPSTDVICEAHNHPMSTAQLPVTYTASIFDLTDASDSADVFATSISPSSPVLTSQLSTQSAVDNETGITAMATVKAKFNFYFDGDCQKFSSLSYPEVISHQFKELILNVSAPDDLNITVMAIQCDPDLFTVSITYTAELSINKYLDRLFHLSSSRPVRIMCNRSNSTASEKCFVIITKYEEVKVRLWPQSMPEDGKVKVIILVLAASVCAILLAAGGAIFGREMYLRRSSRDLAARKKQDKRQRSESVALRSFPAQTAIYSTVEMTEEGPSYADHSEAHMNPAFSDSLDRRATKSSHSEGPTTPSSFNHASDQQELSQGGGARANSQGMTTTGAPFNLPNSRASYGLVVGLLGFNKMADDEAHHYAVPHKVVRPGRKTGQPVSREVRSMSDTSDNQSRVSDNQDNTNTDTLPRPPRFLQRVMSSPADAGSSENLLPRGREEEKDGSLRGADNPLASKAGSTDSMLI